MTSRHDLYGSKTETLHQVKDRLEAELDVRFSLHDSDFIGGEYYLAENLGETRSESISIEPHRPDEEGYYNEPDFADWPVVVHIDFSHRWDDIERAAGNAGLTRLRSTVLD